jgi:hypothetical protein
MAKGAKAGHARRSPGRTAAQRRAGDKREAEDGARFGRQVEIDRNTHAHGDGHPQRPAIAFFDQPIAEEPQRPLQEFDRTPHRPPLDCPLR